MPDVQAAQAVRAVRADVQAVYTAQARVKDKSKKRKSKAGEDEKSSSAFCMQESLRETSRYDKIV